MITKLIMDASGDAFFDTLRALPFLVAAFLLMEFLEKHEDGLAGRIFLDFGKAGPLAAALMGLIPQCGFSVAAANLYAGGIITTGTLIAVFLATSDEALIIMLSTPGAGESILPLLIAKLLIAVFFGYLIDLFFMRGERGLHIDEICVDCGCHEYGDIVRPALIHTGRIVFWLFLITFVLNLLLETCGADALSEFLGGSSLMQPFLTAFIGLIPNCAVSVLLTKLYLAGTLSFASTVAGLSSGAGLGLIVLFRIDRDRSDALRIMITLYICAAAAGVFLLALC